MVGCWAMVASAISAELSAVGAILSPENHAYGRTLSANELRGRVVLIWNIDNFISIERDDDRDNNQWGRSSRNDDDDEDDDNSLKGIEKAIRKAAKGAVKDGRLCVIAVCARTDSPMQDKRKIAGIRRAKPYFPVYFGDVASVLFDAKGEKVCDVNNVKDIAEGDRLVSTIEAAPDYLPGRIILIKSEHNSTLSNRFVIGKNIEQPLNQLRQVARGRGEKAEEAKQMLEEIKAYLDETARAIESELSSAPSLAVANITTFMKTSPSAARQFAQPYARFSNAQEVKFMSSVRQFLRDAAMGEYGTGDLGRYADNYTGRLNKIKDSKDSAISTEASDLINALTPYTSAVLAEARAAEQEANRAQREKDDENDDNENSWERSNRRRNDDDDKKAPERVTAYSAVESYVNASEETEDFINDLKKLDIRTTNFDTILNSYRGLASRGVKGAEAMAEAITSHRQAKLEELIAIVKEGRILDLHDETADWEQVLETNYPTFQRTPPGGFAIKALRNSEVRKIYLAYHDATEGEPRQKESSGRDNYRRSDSSEDFEVRKIQYKVSKLKALQKYLRTNSQFGKICVKHLASMGYSVEEIEEQIKSEQASIKEKKKVAKEAEKARREAEKNR